MTRFPSVSLAIDNCFASKRWTRPREWMELARQFGLQYVEASADTEADPLYCGEEYMEDWVDEVSRCERETGVKVVNLYSGHGTYSTLGLGHTDERVRQRLLDSWVKPMIRAAARLRAGLGFYCHAFPDAVLQDPSSYAEQLEQLYDRLSQVAAYAAAQGVGAVGVEQMYSPHQVPWTIAGARDLICKVFSKSRSPLYLTIDTGHQTGQRRFVRPSASTVIEQAKLSSASGEMASLWLGSRAAHDHFDRCVRNGGAVPGEDLSFIMADMDRHPFMFSQPEDADAYSWLASLGCFSPIVHLQQVTGASSSHLPFTAQTNVKGIIHPDRVLRTLMESYLHAPPAELPAQTGEIYLTVEVFSGTAQTYREIESNLRATVEYWRRFVPEDGTRLDSLARPRA
jgi:D-erythrulose 1-phosphate 3-epimerase